MVNIRDVYHLTLLISDVSDKSCQKEVPIPNQTMIKPEEDEFKTSQLRIINPKS